MVARVAGRVRLGAQLAQGGDGLGREGGRVTRGDVHILRTLDNLLALLAGVALEQLEKLARGTRAHEGALVRRNRGSAAALCSGVKARACSLLCGCRAAVKHALLLGLGSSAAAAGRRARVTAA